MKDDMSLFMHRVDCADEADTSTTPAKEDHLLRFWEKNKGKYLRKMLGDQLIVSKPITYDQDRDSLMQQLNDFLRKHNNFTHDFMSKLESVLHIRSSEEDHRFYDTIREAFHGYNLLDGVLNRSAHASVCGKEISIMVGQKSMRAFGKIAEAMGMVEAFEQFRIQHSQVLNQKKVSGFLNLSIHPVDFTTASDNANGWSSCMSWDEDGCYRMGTVEMMNSPMVICAYLSSAHNVMSIGDQTWPSKKWRAWIIVTPEVILVNRNYPYNSDFLSIAALEWAKELAQTNLGWEYCEKEVSISNRSNVRGYRDLRMEFECDYMYNDVSCDHHAFLSTKYAEMDRYYPSLTINFSGPANCMHCGTALDYEENSESGTLLCPECAGRHRCSSCGSPMCDDDYVIGPNGEYLCTDCADGVISYCAGCGTDRYTEDMIQIDFHTTEEHLATASNEFLDAEQLRYRYFFADTLSIEICDSCWESFMMPLHKKAFLPNSVSIYSPTNTRSWMSNGVVTGRFLNPNVVTVEQFLKLFGNDWGDKKTAIYTKLWELYTIDYNTKVTSLEF